MQEVPVAEAETERERGRCRQTGESSYATVRIPMIMKVLESLPINLKVMFPALTQNIKPFPP